MDLAFNERWQMCRVDVFIIASTQIQREQFKLKNGEGFLLLSYSAV